MNSVSEAPSPLNHPPAVVFFDSRLEGLSGHIRSRPLSSLGFGTRVSRVLARAGIGSIGQLVDTLKAGLPSYADFGPGSAAELASAMEKLTKKSAVKKMDVEARYYAGGSATFYFRSRKLKKLSDKQLNRPVETLGLGEEAVRFAHARCFATSLGRFIEKCADGVKNASGDNAHPIPQIVKALCALNDSVTVGGRVDWKAYRRLSGLSRPLVGTRERKTRSEKRASVLTYQLAVRSAAVAHYPGYSTRVQFRFPELALLSDGAKTIELAPLLSRRALNIYSSMGVSTLEALVALAAKGFSQPSGFGRKCYAETAALLQAAASVTDKYGEIDLALLCKNIGRPLKALSGTASGRPSDPSYTVQFPLLRYSTKRLERLSDQMRGQSLHNLHLDSRAATTMEKIGVRDVGGFVDLLKEGINANKLRNFGRTAFNDLLAALTALSSSIDAKEECDWVAYASARGFKALPSAVIETPREAVEQMADIVEQAIEAQFRGQKDFRRQMDVFKGRLHSPINDYLTLEQLGTRHKLSRERIRQNEMHIARCISAPLLLGCYSVPVIRSKGKSYDALRFRFRPVVESTLQSANEALNAEGRKVWRLDDWVQFLSQLWNADPHLVERNALLLSVLFRFSLEAQTVDGETKGFLLVSEEVPTAVRQELRELLKVIHLSMQGSAEGLSTAEILALLSAAKVLKGLALKAEDLMALSPAVFPIQPGVWKIKPEFFKPKVGKLTCDAAYEILSENGSRMHNSQLLRRFKLRHPDLLQSDRLLTVRMFVDPRFRPIGRSGYWVLAEWNQETGTIREVIAKVLEEAEGPMHINDILRVVRVRVPCKETSIRAYLAESPDQYIKLSSVTYGWASRYPNRLRHEDA